jgi:hypothetical protein
MPILLNFNRQTRQIKAFFMMAMLFTCLIGVIATSQAVADYISPELIKVKTEHYAPSNVNLPRGSYVYQIAWQGIPVARSEILVSDKETSSGQMVSVIAKAKTGSFIDVFYKLRHESASLFRPQTFQPVNFRSYQKENSRVLSREINFDPNGVISFKEMKKGKDLLEKSFDPQNLTFDPISAVFFARSIPLKIGEDLTFDVFNGKHRYLITFNAVAKEKLQLGDNYFDTVKLVPTVKKLTDTKGEKKFHSATIWVTDDEYRQILKLESSVFVGSVSATLESYTPEITPDSPISSTVQAIRINLDPDSNRVAVAAAD